jgi:hypothetical protein
MCSQRCFAVTQIAAAAGEEAKDVYRHITAQAIGAYRTIKAYTVRSNVYVVTVTS